MNKPVRVQETKTVHGAIDFLENSMLIGFRIYEADKDGELKLKTVYLFEDGHKCVLEKDAKSITIEDQRYVILPSSPPFLKDRWSEALLNAFIANPVSPAGPIVFNSVVSALLEFIDLGDLSYYYLIVAWCIATYLSHLFPAYPFLFCHGPKETGKSKLLEVLEQICFNAIKVRDVTPAALGDTVDEQRGTILIDQAEALKRHLVGILADSYKKSGGKRRVIDYKNGERSVLEFATYGPKVFAAYKNMDPDLLDRCVAIPMVRTNQSLPDLLGYEPEWPILRDQIIRWVLHFYKSVREAFSNLTPDGNRRSELWRPLNAVLIALDVEEYIIDQAKIAFDAGTEVTKHQLESEESEFFEYLLECSETKTKPFILTVPEMAEAMIKRIEEVDLDKLKSDDPLKLAALKRKWPQWVGSTIIRFSLGKQQKRKGSAKIRRYEFDPAHIKELYQIYAER